MAVTQNRRLGTWLTRWPESYSRVSSRPSAGHMVDEVAGVILTGVIKTVGGALIAFVGMLWSTRTGEMTLRMTP